MKLLDSLRIRVAKLRRPDLPASSTIEMDIAGINDDVLCLAPLKEVCLLDDDRMRRLLEIKDDLMEGTKKRQHGRPEYLMRVSVLKSTRHPTDDSQYWQSILERDVQLQNLLFEAVDFKEKTAEAEELSAQIEQLVGSAKADRLLHAKVKRLQAQKQRLLLQLLSLKKQSDERCREIFAWTKIIKELEPKLKYSKGDPEAHMPESFMIRFAKERLMLQEIGATDMSGAMNIIGLGETALRYWKEHEGANKELEGGEP
jgi:hypothetical protein